MKKYNFMYFNKITFIVGNLLVILFGCGCMWLYYNQALKPQDVDSTYFLSDLPNHIRMGVNGELYSILGYIYKVLRLSDYWAILIALFLSVISVATVYLTEYLLKYLFGYRKANNVTLYGGLITNFVMPAYVSGFGSGRYVSYQSGNIWHNSTYQVMKLFALLVMIIFFKLSLHTDRKLSFKHWILFSSLLTLCTAIKPSFLVVFAPSLCLKLIFDLVRKNRKFPYIVSLGSTVLPACAIVIIQNYILFSNENGIEIAILRYFSIYAKYPVLVIICSICFPLFILLCNLKELYGDEKYRFCWLMILIGLVQASLLVETGKRAHHGNFIWGYSFAIFIIIVFSYKNWIELFQNRKFYMKYIVVLTVSTIILIYQLYCGVYFWLNLLLGSSYFM